MRKFQRTAVPVVAIAALLAGTSSDALALMVAPNPPGQRVLGAQVVLTGKVTGFEKELVKAAAPYAGATNTHEYKIATIKIDAGLAGTGKMTEVRVGFVPPPKPDPNAKLPPVGLRPMIGGGPRIIPGMEPKEGQELLMFLVKHPTADFYIIPGGTPSIDLKDEQGKKDLEAVKKVVAVLADPMKGLTSDKAEVRAETATLQAMKYRSYPALGGEVEPVAIGADESKLILKGLAEGDWSTNNNRFGGPPSPFQAFQQLALTPKDGWVPPVIVNQPGAPPVDYGAVHHDAYMKWLAGPGKDYQIKKLVTKPAAKK